MADPFPRSIDRGLIEAGDFAYRLPRLSIFPRSIDRGLIEARRFEPGWGRKSHFRDQLIAASLKPTVLGATADQVHLFPRSIDRGLIEAGLAFEQIGRATWRERGMGSW